jgi:hypothetical protein
MGSPVWSETKTGAKGFPRALEETLQQVQGARKKARENDIYLFLRSDSHYSIKIIDRQEEHCDLDESIQQYCCQKESLK